MKNYIRIVTRGFCVTRTKITLLLLAANAIIFYLFYKKVADVASEKRNFPNYHFFFESIRFLIYFTPSAYQAEGRQTITHIMDDGLPNLRLVGAK